MAITTMVLGKSGTGKSRSLINFNPEDVALIQAIKKPLPFRSKEWKPYPTDDHSKILQAMHKAVQAGRKIIVIDDFQYVMANEFMRRSDETGFAKFTEIGKHAWEIISHANALPDDVRVYILSHTEESDNGQIKIKTIGKMLDEKITLEGMVTICLRTHVDGEKYFFATQNNGSDTVKSPEGLFESRYIENDLAAVDAAITEYYGA